MFSKTLPRITRNEACNAWFDDRLKDVASCDFIIENVTRTGTSEAIYEDWIGWATGSLFWGEHVVHFHHANRQRHQAAGQCGGPPLHESGPFEADVEVIPASYSDRAVDTLLRYLPCSTRRPSSSRTAGFVSTGFPFVHDEAALSAGQCGDGRQDRHDLQKMLRTQNGTVGRRRT